MVKLRFNKPGTGFDDARGHAVNARHCWWLNDSTEHPQVSRRVALQGGAIGLLGLGINHLEPLRALGATVRGGGNAGSDPVRRPAAGTVPRAKSVIYIFLSGGLSQLESFD